MPRAKALVQLRRHSPHRAGRSTLTEYRRQCPLDRAWHQDLRPSGLHAIGDREAVLGCRVRRDEHGLATERRLSNQIRFGVHCHASVSAKSGAYADMRTTSAFRSRSVRNAASANAACQTLQLSPRPTGVVCRVLADEDLGARRRIGVVLRGVSCFGNFNRLTVRTNERSAGPSKTFGRYTGII